MPKSGKTTFLGAFDLQCRDRSIKHRENFKYYVKELGVYDSETEHVKFSQAASRLKRGRFPDKTEVGQLYHAESRMYFKRFWGWQQVSTPWIEPAGENVAKFLSVFGSGTYNPNKYSLSTDPNSSLYTQLLEARGHIVLCPAPWAQSIDGAIGAEVEPVDYTVSGDPDLDTRTYLASVFDFCEKHDRPRPEGILVIITKTDLVIENLKDQMNIDLKSPAGRETFMTKYFDATYSLLLHYGIEKVQFNYFHVWVNKDPKSKKPYLYPYTYKDKDGNVKTGHEQRISVDPKTNRPFYPRDQVDEIIDWIRDMGA